MSSLHVCVPRRSDNRSQEISDFIQSFIHEPNSHDNNKYITQFSFETKDFICPQIPQFLVKQKLSIQVCLLCFSNSMSAK